MLMNNKFKAQTLTGNPTGNYRCQLFASRALNMSCYFSQSARSIESRCVVIKASIITAATKFQFITRQFNFLVPKINDLDQEVVNIIFFLKQDINNENIIE